MQSNIEMFNRLSVAPGGQEWTAPNPMRTPKRPAFPLEALPETLRTYAAALAEQLQMYPDMPALLALAAVSTACTGKVQVQGNNERWLEEIATYTLCVLPSGERKSPAFKDALVPVKMWEMRKADELRTDIAANKSKKRQLQNKLQAAEKSRKKGAEQQAEQLARQLAEFVDLSAPCLILQDVTPEALANRLKENHGAGAIWSSEAGTFISNLIGRYAKSNSGPNIDLVLQAFSGETVTIDRIGRERETIRNPALTIMLCGQPDILNNMLGNKEFDGRGLCGRFIYSLPESFIGERKQNAAAVPQTVWEAYFRIIDGLLEIPYPDQRHILHMDDDACGMFTEWGAEIEPLLADELQWIRSWANKLQGLTLRIAGQLHMAQYRSWEIRINAETMHNAILISRYALEHAKAAFGQQASDATSRLADKILVKIRDQQRTAISNREAMRLVSHNAGVKTDDIKHALQLLEDDGYLRYDQANKIYLVNPLALQRG